MPQAALNATSPWVSTEAIGPLVEAFLDQEGDACTATMLGKLATKNPSQVFRLREGAEIRRATINALVAVIEDKRPGFTKKFLTIYNAIGGRR
jgi:hypothetical protein